jgi:serine/threonine protein kinase
MSCKFCKKHIDEVLFQQLGLVDIEEIFIKEMNMPLVQIYKFMSVLGVGAFGVVLEVENKITKEISALKVIFY